MFQIQKKEDENIEKETILLYNLKFKKEQEILFKNENLSNTKYFAIDDKKLKELEKVFKQVKTNIKFNFNLKERFIGQDKAGILPEILFDMKIEEQKRLLCIIYDETHFSKKIEIEISDLILFAEKLENKDLILLILNDKNYEILIYRHMPEQKIENKGYILIQKIKETLEGYEQKYDSISDDEDEYYYMPRHKYKEKKKPIEYNLFYIKGISKNRFFSVSNYGFKMYALNEKNEYELVLLESYERISFIYEMDTNKFIFGLNLWDVKGHGFCGNAYTYYYNLFLNKIELKNIDKIENKSEQEKSKNIHNIDNLKLKEKLKFSFISQTIYESHYYSNGSFNIKVYFSDFVVLKNKFFIIMVKNNILIFNMETGKEIKRFKIEISEYIKTDIKKWEIPENNEFILIIHNNVILFKLSEENSSKISLNIISYGYFPNLCIKYYNNNKEIVKNLKKINGKKNRFFSYTDSSNDICIY